ncbi:MAG: argininosuccinate lyase [Helicobacteraceae bacterium]|jgi:argininosuccinate lyase|nr:argininosuccinate lyase [Helicobacteraceae bacterium]
MSAKLWGDGGEENVSKLLEEFNASIGFDRALYKEDIEGSIAHAEMLQKQGIIDANDLQAIRSGLEQIKGEIERGEFEFKIADEDIHMAIETRLTALIGDAGKRLHTARSRNDQVALDFRLWTLRQNAAINALLIKLVKTALTIAKDHTKTLIPGYTHLQHAQPISLAHHLLAYCAMFMRDFERFDSSYVRNNFSPLGSAALAGTPHNIDRAAAAKALGFERATLNAADSVSDRDFALEILFNASVAQTHLSRLCEELIIWSSSEFGFIRISDRFTTGSSIMPQKRNPDAAELIRGKTGRIFGDLIGLLTVMKGLPLAYNKDLQEDKEGVFDAVKTLKDSLKITIEMIGDKETKFNVNNMRAACQKGHLTATDLADAATRKGIAFREAHHLARKVVALADQKGLDLSELNAADLAQIDERLSDLAPSLDLFASMNARKSEGGTAQSAVLEQIQKVENWLAVFGEVYDS